MYGMVKGFLVWLLSGRILDRVMLLMNDKQNRWARSQRSRPSAVTVGHRRVVDRVVAPTLACLAWSRRMPMKRHE